MHCILCQAKSAFFVSLHDSDYYRCRCCQLIFLDPAQRLNAAQEKAKYDQHQNSPDDQGYRRFLQPAVEQVLANVKAGGKGLDFGCGPGPTASVMLADRGVDCVNYDPIYQPNKALLQQQYDFVICTEVMEHCFDPVKVIKQMQGLLRPGGFIVLMTLFFDDPSQFAASHYHRDPTHIGFYASTVFRWLGNCLQMSPIFPGKNLVIFQST